MDGWDPDLLLVKRAPFLSEEDAVCNGSVSVSVCVMIQADHVALCDKVKEDRGQEGEDTDDSTEHGLQGEALHSQSSLQQDLRHEEEAGPAGAVREQLHT